MKSLPPIAVLLLGACATTPQQFTDRPADAEIQLRQPPEQAALCITRNIEKEIGNITIDRRPTARGHELIARIISDFPTTYAIADLTPTPTGSRARIWTVQHGLSAPATVAQQISQGC